jgi:hypothetical protein
MEDVLRNGLLAMQAEDRRVRAELLADGSLGDGYHPRMEEVHRRNAARLTEIIAGHGWPGRGLVGEDGARAARFVLQHTIRRGRRPAPDKLSRSRPCRGGPRWLSEIPGGTPAYSAKSGKRTGPGRAGPARRWPHRSG